MTFENAIQNLEDGKAAKLASWGGYFYRSDVEDGIPEYSEEKPYTQGDIVRFDGRTYICILTCEAGMWDPEDWTSTNVYRLTLRKRSNENGSPCEISYLYTPTYQNGRIVYKATSEGAPITLDGQLLQAFQSSEWVVGDMNNFEMARIGTSNIW